MDNTPSQTDSTDNQAPDNDNGALIIASGLSGLLLAFDMVRNRGEKARLIILDQPFSFFHCHHPLYFERKLLEDLSFRDLDIPPFTFTDPPEQQEHSIPVLKPLCALIHKLIEEMDTAKIAGDKMELWGIFKLAQLLSGKMHVMQDLVKKLHTLSLDAFLREIVPDEKMRRQIMMDVLLWHKLSPKQPGSALHALRLSEQKPDQISLHGDLTQFRERLIKRLHILLGEDMIRTPLMGLRIRHEGERFIVTVNDQTLTTGEVMLDAPPKLVADYLLDIADLTAHPPPQLFKIRKSMERSTVIRMHAQLAEPIEAPYPNILHCPDTTYLEQAYTEYMSGSFSEKPIISAIVSPQFLSIEAQFFDEAWLKEDDQWLPRKEKMADILLDTFAMAIDQPKDSLKITGWDILSPADRDTSYGTSHPIAFDQLLPVGHLMGVPFLKKIAQSPLYPGLKFVGFGADAGAPPIRDLAFKLSQI